MKITSKPQASILIGIFFIFLVLGVYLQVLWADWAVQKIFNKDFHGFKIFLTLFVIETLAPKAITGITTIILLLMTLYIFLTA